MSNLIYGFHSVIGFIKNNVQYIDVMYIDQNRKDKRQNECLVLIKQYNVPFEFVNNERLNSLVGTVNHQGIVARIKMQKKIMPNLDLLLEGFRDKKNALILILDGITDTHNLGAIIRTADCFGVDMIIVPKDNAANADNPVVAKVSSGAVNNIPIITVNNLNRTIELLKNHEFWIAGTSLTNTSVELFDFRADGRIAWVMGSEDHGIRRLVAKNCDYLVTIPMFGKTQSLNVSVATGVILSYTRLRQQNKFHVI